MSYFTESVHFELLRARTKHPIPIYSRHEGFAVLLEEVEEVKEAVFRDHDTTLLRKELVQVAAMAQRMAEDLGL